MPSILSRYWVSENEKVNSRFVSGAGVEEIEPEGPLKLI